MTLSTPRIQYFGIQLYTRFLNNTKLGEDACITLYEQFVHRLKKYRNRHPEATKVSPAFLKKCEKWIVTDLMRKRKRAKQKERFEQAVAESLTNGSSYDVQERCTFMYVRLAEYFKKVIDEKPNMKKHIEIFLLYNSYFITHKLNRMFAPIIGVNKSALSKKVKKINKIVLKTTARLVQKHMDNAHRWYCRMMNADIRIDTCDRNEKKKWVERRALYRERHEEELTAAKRIQPYPFFKDIAKVLGMSQRQVRYSVVRCREGIREYVEGW